jgi:beta-galactosidase GanA
VFGESIETEEIFQAYYYARFIDAVAAAGKREYALPMYVNAALNRPGTKPGQYPSAGPLPHLFDVWKLAAPHLDLLAPDIYFPDFEHWCRRFDCSDNRLFIPEATNGTDCAAHALYAFGAHQALGFSPFAVEAIDPETTLLRDCYRALRALNGDVVNCRKNGAVHAVLLTREQPSTRFELGGYRMNCSHDFTWEWSGPERLRADWPKAGAMILATGPDEFVVLGSGVIVTFDAMQVTGERVGIASIDEHITSSGGLVKSRRLNGDESHQGRHLRLQAHRFGVQSIRLYRYR